MQTRDVEAGLLLCRASGWNQVARDWELFLTLNPRGCFVATNAAGDVIGSVATLRYQRRFSWIAMVLVDPAYRGRGVERELVVRALHELDDERPLRLDATPAGVGLYPQLGLRKEARRHRWKRNAGSVPRLTGDRSARPMASRDLAAIFEIDREVFGADPCVLLTSLVSAAPGYAWIVDGPTGRPRGIPLRSTRLRLRSPGSAGRRSYGDGQYDAGFVPRGAPRPAVHGRRARYRHRAPSLA
ncbi:MAG: GNAT family N-acetyltransferase [Luteitalea sp.]|nr:GNAT family N-acetyltransferase [Luteitalea sp.]